MFQVYVVIRFENLETIGGIHIDRSYVNVADSFLEASCPFMAKVPVDGTFFIYKFRDAVHNKGLFRHEIKYKYHDNVFDDDVHNNENRVNMKYFYKHEN